MWYLTLFISIFIHINKSTADTSSIQQLYDEISNNTISGRGNLIDLKFIDTNYGCHCRNFNHNLIKTDVALATKGQHVDSVDETCKYLHNGWSCLATRDNCDINQPYTMPSLINFTPFADGVPFDDCENLNQGNQCSIDICKVELSFVINLFNNMFLGNYDENMTDEQGFDAGDNCPTVKGDCVSRKCCFGEYPYKEIVYVCEPIICPS